MIIIKRLLLTPLSWLYGLGVWLRNKLFDMGILKSKSFDVPIISVGNLAVGGTGKTPQVEYLAKMLQKEGLRVAILSRGYGRKTTGYLLANAQSTFTDIGDEPLQLKRKFGEGVQVAVDGNRCRAVKELCSMILKPDVILLDDAYQHRYIKPGLSILLTDYSHLFSTDKLLPSGRLREPIGEKRRADMVIITKCPECLSVADFDSLNKQLGLYPYQKLFFSGLQYALPEPLFANAATKENDPLCQKNEIVLLTGIANPEPMKALLTRLVSKVHFLTFSDHHVYSRQDLLKLQNMFWSLPVNRRFIITTEKDASRLIGNAALNETLKPYIYTLPVSIKFLRDEEEVFKQTILDYVRENTRNRSLH